ncbi:hypothetical protein VN97_g584 [Penicillium thymicola]|uniref:Uncharacterized protein n=1 Tax=Penicillium thymicola TaxID=293382 RepID=A0AAI9TSM4_PENTH|nr:hypothetical protein VN97_g584 [Penicillium thymicola]
MYHILNNFKTSRPSMDIYRSHRFYSPPNRVCYGNSGIHIFCRQIFRHNSSIDITNISFQPWPGYTMKTAIITGITVDLYFICCPCHSILRILFDKLSNDSTRVSRGPCERLG